MALTYRREIDGLRAIAVAAVVLCHAGLMEVGYVGVDVFFVISGYLITALLLREHATTERIDLVSFYGRRARRILPAALLMMGVVGVAGFLFFSGRALVALADSVAASAVFAANFYFQGTTFGYFDQNSEHMPLLHMWSLAVEEQFYLVWPALLVVLLRWRSRLPTVVACLAIASFALTEWYLRTNPKTAFYQMPPRFWELAVGGFVATLSPRRLPSWTAWIGLVVLLDACVVPLPFGFPGLGALPAVGGAVVLIAAIHGGAANALLSSRPFVGLGLISYSLYLWHWPLLAFYRALGGTVLATRLALCGCAVVLAIASYRFVEAPWRRRQSQGSAIVLLVCAFALAVAAAIASFVWNRTPQAIAARDWPANKTSCGRSQGDASLPVGECSHGSPVRIAVWGDSMAMAWQPLAREMARRQRVGAITYSKDACKPAVGYEGAHGPECAAFNRGVLERVQRLDVVILVAWWDYDVDRRATREGMPRTLQALRDVGRVILLGPTPTVRHPAPECMAGNDLQRCTVLKKEFLRVTADERRFLSQLAASYPNVEYVDAGPWFCDGEVCPATRDGIVLYWDNLHVSSTAAREFTRQWLAQPTH